jgi:hypothetical protein
MQDPGNALGLDAGVGRPPTGTGAATTRSRLVRCGGAKPVLFGRAVSLGYVEVDDSIQKYAGSVGKTVVDSNGIATQPKMRVWRLGALGLLAGTALFMSTGCAALGLSKDPSKADSYSVDPGTQFVVVTLGGSPVPTSGPGVAPTIPESTPVPRIELPARDASSTAGARPAASPALSRGNTQARAGNP